MEDTNAATALADYRIALYQCFLRGRDAAFDLCDALATYQTASSFVHLALAPRYQRRFSSLYQALTQGRLEQEALRRLFVRTAPAPAPEARLLLAVDASSLARPYARTSPERTLVQVPAQGHVLPRGGTLTRPGWAYSLVAVVPATPSAWTHTLDTCRIPSTQTATTVGAAQLAALVPLLPVRPLCLADGGYGTVGWLQATTPLPLDQLIRATATRVLYRPAPPAKRPARTSPSGWPTVHGQRSRHPRHTAPDVDRDRPGRHTGHSARLDGSASAPGAGHPAHRALPHPPHRAWPRASLALVGRRSPAASRPGRHPLRRPLWHRAWL